jgi:4,5-dihydroxyphthalate decarboxylase
MTAGVTAELLEIPVSIMRYDVTMPLLEGRVAIDGVTLVPAKTSSMVGKDMPELREGRFGLWDLNLGYWLAAIDAGWDLVALPVFPKRKSVLPMIFCRRDRGIGGPQDLAGTRVGTRQYRTAVTLWASGLLEDFYGVDTKAIRWVSQTAHHFPLHEVGTQIEVIGDGKPTIDLLLDGDIDVLMTDISDGALFERLERSPEIMRLFPDYEAEDLGLWRDKQIFPPMHVMVMSGRLDRDNPGLARRLYDGFAKAKQLAEQDIAGDRGGFSILYLRERFKGQQEVWGDPMAYGMTANRTMMDAFRRYNHRQGSTRTLLDEAQIFASGTLDT